MKTNVVALAFLAFAMFVVIGAWNGKFSPKSAPPQFTDFPEAMRLTKELDEARAALKTTEDAKFLLENDSDILSGTTTDNNSKIRELLDEIGRLSAMINQLTDENKHLRELLTQLTKDFEALRKKLKLCEAQDAARRLERQYCKMETPSNLLR